MRPKTRKLGNLTIRYYDSFIDPGQLFNSMKEADPLPHLGRGGIKIIEVDGNSLVSRKYLHGGLLRLLTGDRFFSEKRCRAEVEIIHYLRGKAFPVVTPFATMVEKRFITYRLNLLTIFEQESVSLLDYLKTASHGDRMSMIGGFIHLFCRLQSLGVYHPDLHINNVLITSTHKLLLLDFDRAQKRDLTRKDRESMLWRLMRHINKMERLGRLKLDDKEKNHLLKTYSRMSGIDAKTTLARKARMGLYFHKVGSIVESLLYRGKK
jgi:3-deoxy-D-manno-octulosonic acid kinase